MLWIDFRTILVNSENVVTNKQIAVLLKNKFFPLLHQHLWKLMFKYIFK